MTFDQAATATRDKLKSDAEKAKKPWGERHTKQWLQNILDHASPTLGAKRVGYVTHTDIYNALEPIWQSQGPTAAKVLERIGMIMSWAKATGRRTGDNPVNEARILLGKQLHETQHNPAIPFPEIPAFYQRIDDLEETPAVKLALRCLILNASRPAEVRLAKVSEIDLQNASWEIPGERMKSRKPHRIPLSVEALAVVREALNLHRTGEYLFPGQKPAAPIHRDALLVAIKRAGYEATSHGCRSSFRDWVREASTFEDALAEAALAHKLKDRTVRSYARGTLFEKRREMMAAWAEFLTGTNANVIEFKKAEA
ncbi:MAG: tyrosine-type recombinase/integrase [Sphingomonadales bacterium]